MRVEPGAFCGYVPPFNHFRVRSTAAVPNPLHPSPPVSPRTLAALQQAASEWHLYDPQDIDGLTEQKVQHASDAGPAPDPEVSIEQEKKRLIDALCDGSIPAPKLVRNFKALIDRIVVTQGPIGSSIHLQELRDVLSQDYVLEHGAFFAPGAREVLEYLSPVARQPFVHEFARHTDVHEQKRPSEAANVAAVLADPDEEVRRAGQLIELEVASLLMNPRPDGRLNTATLRQLDNQIFDYDHLPALQCRMFHVIQDVLATYLESQLLAPGRSDPEFVKDVEWALGAHVIFSDEAALKTQPLALPLIESIQEIISQVNMKTFPLTELEKLSNKFGKLIADIRALPPPAPGGDFPLRRALIKHLSDRLKRAGEVGSWELAEQFLRNPLFSAAEDEPTVVLHAAPGVQMAVGPAAAVPAADQSDLNETIQDKIGAFSLVRYMSYANGHGDEEVLERCRDIDEHIQKIQDLKVRKLWVEALKVEIEETIKDGVHPDVVTAAQSELRRLYGPARSADLGDGVREESAPS